MRTMLILVLFCGSLTQFVIASPLPECEKTYACYAPEACVDSNKPDLNTNKVVLVATQDVLSTCQALIKIHEYRPNWAYVSIESLADGVSSIVFNQKRLEGEYKSKLSCALNGVITEGKYLDSKKYSKVAEPGSKLKCAFEIRIKMSEKVFDGKTSDSIFIDVVSVAGTFQTDETRNIILQKSGCDPSQFTFSKDIETVNKMKNERGKVYAEIKYEPGKYECENPKIFKKTYRKDGSDYAPINNIECEFKFKIDGKSINPEESIDIRCEADAHFFCKDDDYNVNIKGSSPVQTKSDWKQDVPQPSSLMCPSDQPHLIINTKLILNANLKIKCLNYGRSKFWTVEDNGNSYPLTTNGPEVYCTAVVKCDQKYRILETAVPKGRLGSDHFPECFATGVLKVNKEKVTDHKCDTSTGDFKYSTGGEYKIVTSDTKFDCEYPKNTQMADEKAAKQHTAFIGAGVGITIVVGVIVVIAVIVGSCYGVKEVQKRNDKRNAELLSKNAVLLARYCMTDKEREAANIEAESSGEGHKNSIAESSWNKQLMLMQARCLEAKLKTPTSEVPIIVEPPSNTVPPAKKIQKSNQSPAPLDRDYKETVIYHASGKEHTNWLPGIIQAVENNREELLKAEEKRKKEDNEEKMKKKQ